MRIRTIIIAVVAIGCLGLVCVALVLFKQAQDKTLAQFGEKAVVLCDHLNPDLTGKGNVEDVRDKLAIINTSTMITSDELFDALPAERRAQNKEELTGVVCISTGSTVYDTDTYGSGNVEKYTCTRYRSTTTAYVFDAKSGQLIANRTFEGDTPPSCPERTNKNISQYGNSPDSQLILDWLLS
jgi:hypothetical protein